MKITMYTRKYCSFCVRAKRLLDDLGLAYREISVDGDPEALVAMKASSGRQTVPQIWIGSTHIGGCDELMQVHASGRLLELVAGTGE